MANQGRFPIVGVGASAGGIEALEGFFRGIPDEPGFGIVIITHLNPARESILHEIIARFTKMRVAVAADGDEVEPNCVYVLPADTILSLADGKLVVIQAEPGRRERKPIDVFFSALAIDFGEYAAGVVLSGSDGDGTLGIKAIKERGGLTLAQVKNGHGPGHPSMPDSAISTGLVDFAVPAEEMGGKLVEFAKSLNLLDGPDDTADANGGDDYFEAERLEIYAILRNQVGHDFSGYKSKTFLRRVQRRVQVVHAKTVAAYVERLRQDPSEAQALFRDLLINVTNFFRDAEAFETLTRLVIPRLFESRGAEDTVRVWVPGCATGEEVYSIAILLREHMDTLTAIPRVQIFATDIDDHALAIARAGRYPAALLDSVPYPRRRRFFLSDGAGAYVLAKEVRELCIFSPHSVIRDPPFSRIDLISCRNLLIYFGYDMQGQVIPTFHYALRPGGYLFLGTSENISQYRELFSPIEKKFRIFRSRDDVAPAYRLPLGVRGWRSSTTSEAGQRMASSALSLRQFVQTQVLEQFAPAHVVVNREGDVVYYSTKTGKYLEAAPGVPTRHLITIARRGLRLDLRTAFREAIETNSTITRSGIAVESEDGRVQLVTLTVQPITEAHQEVLYLVLFADEGLMLSREEAERSTQQDSGISVQLESELRDTRERLQSLVEEYETALEELKSSNEELQSVNEEMQSSNEELEASKEELQSVNEELQTVNTELSAKVDALDHANGDLQNLFNATNVATVFLDRFLNIRTFTPAVGRLFNILPTDRGRPITDLSGSLNMPNLAEDVATIMLGTPHIERRISRSDNTGHFLVQFAPYRNVSRAVEGVVVTFVDVTGLTRAEARQQVMLAELQHRTRNLLGVVQAIARQTLDKGDALDAFKDRLSALGRVQGLISSAQADDIDLRALLHLELSAHAAPGESLEPDQITLTGPAVTLRMNRVQPLAMVVHELATNAVKYGALRNVGAKLVVEWHVLGQRDQLTLHLTWRETGVPLPPGSAGKDGFGMQMIKRSLRTALRAKSEVTFGSDGVSVHVAIPLEAGEGLVQAAMGSS